LETVVFRFFFFLQTSIKPNSIKKVWSRRSVISSYLLGKRVLIYNGKVFKHLIVTREHIGFKFGEFIFTKTFSSKPLKKK